MIVEIGEGGLVSSSFRFLGLEYDCEGDNKLELFDEGKIVEQVGEGLILIGDNVEDGEESG